MTKKIISLSDDFEAIPVPMYPHDDYKTEVIAPGEAIELTKEQAAEKVVSDLKAAGIVKVSAGSAGMKKVENISDTHISFRVIERHYAGNRQVVIEPLGEVILTDEQAASPAMREWLEEGKGDDPDDDLPIKGGSGKMYKTIAAAISAGETAVKLMSDFNRTTTIASGKSVEVDLNGKTVKYANSPFKVAGELTIKGDGVIESTRSYALWVDNGGKLKVEGGTIKSVEGCVCFPSTVGGSAVIDGGEFEASDNAVIILNGSEQYGDNTVEVNGGKFIGHIVSAGYIACGIYCPNSDTITVNGGEFIVDGGCGVCARAGKVEINGGSFTTTGDVTGKVGDSRVVVPCAALVFDTDAKYPKLTDESGIAVNGGSFKSEVACVANVGEDRITVNGGEFDPAL